MKITKALLGEHGVFYAQFDYLEHVLPEVESLDLVQRLAGLLAAGLKPHALIENEILFPPLESVLGAEAGPIPVMRMEHDEIEGSLARVQEVRDLDQARNLVLHAIETAREHFSKEEHVLFPMAEQVLDEATLERLGDQWAERRRVKI